jgi:hypothetical protein
VTRAAYSSAAFNEHRKLGRVVVDVVRRLGETVALVRRQVVLADVVRKLEPVEEAERAGDDLAWVVCAECGLERATSWVRSS